MLHAITLIEHIAKLLLSPNGLIFTVFLECPIFKFILTIMLIMRISSQDVLVIRLALGKSRSANPINIVINRLTMGKSLGVNPAKSFLTIFINRGYASYSDESH